MKTNVGTLDRIVRLALALLFSVLYFTGTVVGVWGTVLLVFGAVLLLTAVFARCGIYSMLGLSTCPVKAGS